MSVLVTVRRRRPLLLVALGVGVLLCLAAPRSAAAYPQWQFSSGTIRCNQCHVAPGGGGMITSYGRDAVAEDISTFGGDGAFLHGAMELPTWFALGGDLRLAYVAQEVQDPGGTTQAVFPMQADLAGRVTVGDFTAVGTVGLRGRVRTSDEIVLDQNYQPITASQVISREHYLMWRPSGVGPYARVGRFYAPFGLRFVEHVLYVRRDLGFGMLEETYNVSGGYVGDELELHATLFAPDFVRHIGSTEKGAALYVERRLLGDTAALAAQVRYARGETSGRTILGGVGKLYLESLRTLLLAEGNLVFRDMSAGGGEQFVGAAGAAIFPVRGLTLTLLGERNQVDVSVRDSAWNAATALASWYPFPHFEAQLMGRLQFPTGTDAARTLLLQVHYFL